MRGQPAPGGLPPLTKGEAMTFSFARLRLAAAAVCFASTCSLAQVPGDAGSHALARVAQKLDAGASQDVIVVFEDSAIRRDAELLRTGQRLPLSGDMVADYAAGRYAAKKQQVMGAFAAGEVQIVRDYSHLPLAFLRIHSRAALDRLLADPGVVSAHEDWREPRALAESLPLIGQPQVAAQGALGAGTTVAVLDTGVDYTRAAFGSCTSPGVPASCRVVYAHDFAPDDGKLDTIYHGTNVAGIVLGVAPGTRIAALDVFGADGLSSVSDQLSAMNWVVANRATYNIVAINMSLGAGKYYTPQPGDPRKPAVDAARSAGVLTVAAAGNSAYADALGVPAAIPGVISVGAVYDSDSGPYSWRACSGTEVSATDVVTCFSNSASFLTMLAPGAEILAADESESGTSQASPHVAGAVAVLRAAFPGESLEQTVARLTTGVMVTDPRNDIAKPRLDLQMAMGLPTTCTYAISPSGATAGAGAANGSVTVTTAAGCTWRAAGTADWVAVTAGSSGSGTVSISVSANPGVASRTTSLTIAGIGFTVSQSGAVGRDANILLNPGFEDGPVNWTEISAGGYRVINSYTEPTANDRWVAWLCGYDDCEESVAQVVTIPGDATGAYVRFRYRVETDEPSDASAYDAMELRIFSPPGADTYEYWALSNLDASPGWITSPMIDLSAHKGETIRLEFAAATDASLPTSFFVDDVTLMVSGSALADTQPPSVPTGLKATAVSSTRIDLSWNAATDNVGVTAYKLYLGGNLVATLGNVTGSTRKVNPSSHYTYAVAACDGAGNCSAPSVAAQATTPATADVDPPSVPTGLAATVVSGTRIDLSWNAATDNVGVTAYKVYLGATLVGTLGNVTSSTRKVTPAGTYTYTVAACDAAGNCSAPSTAARATTPAAADGTAPTVPTGLTANVIGSTRIDLSWTAATDNLAVTAYQVYQGGTLIATLGAVTTAKLTVKPSTTYSFSIAACDAAGNCSAQSAAVVATAPAQANYQGLWWNAQEGGWGINFAHQGDIVFATWFTYDAHGKPWWLIAVLSRTAEGVYSGPVSTVAGPLFNSVPFGPAPVEVEVGSMTATFADTTHAAIAYTVNGVAQTKQVTPQVFGPLPTCVWGQQPNLSLATNYQDLWWNPQESGWGINFTHQGDVIFATWFTYDAQGKPWWLIAVLSRTAAKTYSGPVSTVGGPPFNSSPWNGGAVAETEIGRATATFADGNHATFAYTVNGTAQTKAITRQVFAPPGTVCH